MSGTNAALDFIIARKGEPGADEALRALFSMFSMKAEEQFSILTAVDAMDDGSGWQVARELVILQGKSYAEAARATGRSKSTLEKRAAREGWYRLRKLKEARRVDEISRR